MQSNNITTSSHQTNYTSIIEGLLFVSGKPLTINYISNIVKLNPSVIKYISKILSDKYSSPNHGLSLLSCNNYLQLVTKKSIHTFTQNLFNKETSGELSTTAMETLAIIAYKGPIPKSDIEKIRGVNCLYSLRNLQIRGLIEKKQDKKNERFNLYQVTPKFLQHFGISSVNKLKNYRFINKD